MREKNKTRLSSGYDTCQTKSGLEGLDLRANMTRIARTRPAPTERMGGACCGYPNIQIKIKTYIYGHSYKRWWTFKRSISESVIGREQSVLMCLKTPDEVIVRTLF